MRHAHRLNPQTQIERREMRGIGDGADKRDMRIA